MEEEKRVGPAYNPTDAAEVNRVRSLTHVPSLEVVRLHVGEELYTLHYGSLAKVTPAPDLAVTSNILKVAQIKLDLIDH